MTLHWTVWTGRLQPRRLCLSGYANGLTPPFHLSSYYPYLWLRVFRCGKCQYTDFRGIEGGRRVENDFEEIMGVKNSIEFS